MIKRDPSKFVQLGFLGLLFLCIIQVGWWITDNFIYTRYTREVGLELQPIAAGDAHASDVLAGLETASAGRTTRYLWEGGFFLAVLLGGMGVLTRTIRHDSELRRRQQNFLAAVSHEFKSPLASMQLSAETLMMRSTDSDSQRLGQRLLEDCERLLRMVDNLLDTTRLEEGRHVLKPERTQLAAIVASGLTAIRERAARHDVELTSDVPEALLVEADRTAVETILRNLLDNALKACVAGGGRSIRLTANRRDGRVVLSVTDDGLGFSPEDAGMMFEKFYRLGDELRRSTPGTGLGLYIVKRLADLSRAEVHAASEGPGRGATITISWPAVEVSA